MLCIAFGQRVYASTNSVTGVSSLSSHWRRTRIRGRGNLGRGRNGDLNEYTKIKNPALIEWIYIRLGNLPGDDSIDFDGSDFIHREEIDIRIQYRGREISTRLRFHWRERECQWHDQCLECDGRNPWHEHVHTSRKMFREKGEVRGSVECISLDIFDI